MKRFRKQWSAVVTLVLLAGAIACEAGSDTPQSGQSGAPGPVGGTAGDPVGTAGYGAQGSASDSSGSVGGGVGGASSTSAGGSGQEVAQETPETPEQGTGGTSDEPKEEDDENEQPEAGDLSEALAAVADLDAAGFAERTAVSFETLSYDPSEAIGLDLIANSALGMTDAELAKFNENGFVISTRATFPDFGYGYATIYAQDLPVYISADSILYALHKAYDSILKSFEDYLMRPELAEMLSAMRAELAASDLPAEVKRDLDIYLTVPDSLLAGELKAPLASENEQAVTALYNACIQAGAAQPVELFGSTRQVDFSQFTPRGHYTDSPGLTRYFRAMIWLGRIDFRLLESDLAGELQLNRREAEAAVALRTLMDDSARQSHRLVDALVTAFVGEHDYMTAPQVDSLMGELGVSSLADMSSVSDEALKAAITAGGYGIQRISSHIMMGGLGGGSTPLPASFALLGQRYVIDSHVFSNVVYDRVQLSGAQRLMPNPLDVAYAALQNDHAGVLLAPELETYDYASALASMRVVVDSEPREVWEMNLYNRWLDALRSLSPAQAGLTGEGETLPNIAKTEAWGRRLLNTQLASWAELRHDTILYTKQSYTSGAQCEYPDAYVDPYPEFFRKVVAFAEHALGVMAEFGFVVDDPNEQNFDIGAPDYVWKRTVASAQRVLEKFVEVGTILADMAEHQRTGAPHSEAHLAFINETVGTLRGCAGDQWTTGWYGELFVDPIVESSPTIADVHTQPEDSSGSPVGRVLHVGTGNIRLMVTSVESCSGPRAYAGLVSSYYEHIESNWKRLNDIEWEDVLQSDQAPDSPPWVQSLTAE